MYVASSSVCSRVQTCQSMSLCCITVHTVLSRLVSSDPTWKLCLRLQVRVVTELDRSSFDLAS